MSCWSASESWRKSGSLRDGSSTTVCCQERMPRPPPDWASMALPPVPGNGPVFGKSTGPDSRNWSVFFGGTGPPKRVPTGPPWLLASGGIPPSGAHQRRWTMRLDVPRTLLATGALLALGCGAGVAPSAPTDPAGAAASMGLSSRAGDHEGDQGQARFFIYPGQARVDGKTTLGWIPEFWRYIFSVPASQNPELVDSADCGVGQTGPVFFIPGEQHDVYTRSCTIPAHTPVFFAIWSAFNDYPCPDPSFQPAPGQSLEDFLAQGAQAVDNAVKNLAATVDGQSIDVSQYRYTTGLVTFTGDP